MSDIQKSYDFYKTHKAELIQKYKGKFVVIHIDEVKGPFDSAADALVQAAAEFVAGSFIIQQCSEDDQIVQRFYSRVAFA